MPLNVGYIESTCDNQDLVVRIYYDATAPHGTADEAAAQPLIDGPRGYCLDMTNRSGKVRRLTVSGLTENPLTINVGQGDPVVSGPPAGRSRTAAQLAQLGFTDRGSVGNFQLDC